MALISLKEYAKRVGRSKQSVADKVRAGNLEAIKIGSQWVIEEDTPYIDHRTGDLSNRWKGDKNKEI